MNKLVKRHNQLMSDFFPFSIGLDDVFDRLGTIKRDNLCDSFPPYDIIREDAVTSVPIALAGYNKDNIEVLVDDGILSITGKTEKKDTSSHVHQGIATRSFVRKFTLGDYVEVKSADMKDGMLVVTLEEVLPPEKQPKRITIS